MDGNRFVSKYAGETEKRNRFQYKNILQFRKKNLKAFLHADLK